MRALVLVVLVGLVASTAQADDRKLAEKYFRAGERAYQAQNFEAAAHDFEAAYKAAPLPEIAFSAAQAYRRQYRVDAQPEYVARAVALYRIYLDAVKTGGRVADAADAMGEMQHELDRLIKAGVKVSAELAAEHTQFGVNVTLEGAPAAPTQMHEIDEQVHETGPAIAVSFNGKPEQPYTLVNLEPGTYAVHVEAPGYFPVDVQEVVVQGTTTMRDVTLAPRPARVTFHTEADAQIAVDGRPIGTTPLTADVPAGRHVLTILHRGREPVVRDIDLGRGQEATLTQPLAMTARRRAVPYVVIAGGTVAVFSAASAIGALVEDHRASQLLATIDKGNAPQAMGEKYESERVWRDRFVTATWTTGLAALAIGGAAAWLYYADHPQPESTHLVPVAGGDGAGAMLFGSF
jgi:hypothetical protein